MKKQLLFGAMLLGSILSVNAQDSCETALPITIGTTAVGPISGTYPAGICWAAGNTTAPAANWYSFTAIEDVMVRVNTNLASNNPQTVDTRVSVLVGDCNGQLQCWSGSDDVSDTVYLTDFNFDAHAGETYYIVFDNRWTSTAFNVELSYAGTPACTDVTPFNEDWNNEANYYFCWAAFNMNGDALAWQWNNINDLNGDGTPDAAAVIPTPTTGNAAKNEWLISGGLNLVGGETYTITVKYNGFSNGATAVANENLDIVMLNEQSPEALVQTVVQSITGITQQGTLATFEQNATTGTYTFVPNASGVYHLGLHATSASATGWLFVFDVTVTGTTSGTKDLLASSLAVYPNPATNMINVSNADNILVNGIQIVDLNGRTVKSVKYDGVTEAQVNISDLANGVYMMTVSSDKGSVTKKIVKN